MLGPPNLKIPAWSADHPWPTAEEVEQDLLLSRAICAIAADDYSEDLGYVRSSASGIGPLPQALTRLGAELGYPSTPRVSQHPKVYWRAAAATGVPLRLKIEVNTHERSPALPLTTRPHPG
ncbi:hypothetical protein [Propionicicella superfundia]|uniref:hypothetical protein n=1 Tax=Propionicicella superfundia TaxID=348582 RepID=UPI001B7F8F8B|nr:hypothetical protein [Propionicicella superfundia]